jgi:adenine-specific DNA-methyltransferase
MNDAFVFQPMLTCIGNKRKLIPHITQIVSELQTRINPTKNEHKLKMADGFAGSGVVSRALLRYASELHTNDMEVYSYLMACCHLKRPSIEEQQEIQYHIEAANNLNMNIEGVVCKLYAPQNTDNIQPGERCFYTRENALRIDTMRKYIDEKVPKHLQVYILTPLLIKASIHTNTAGVFKGFYKNGDGIGCFGGKGQCALSRILKPIVLEMPVWDTESNANTYVHNSDINKLIETLPSELDIIYLDPPYNQHPYGSNYFMLNVIATNQEPSSISNVSGIPTNWNKSAYNTKQQAIQSMRHLLTTAMTKTKYIVLSYNNEGIIPVDEWNTLFEPYVVEKREITYDTFKGCRNLKDRDNKVIEIMYILSKK